MEIRSRKKMLLLPLNPDLKLLKVVLLLLLRVKELLKEMSLEKMLLPANLLTVKEK